MSGCLDGLMSHSSEEWHSIINHAASNALTVFIAQMMAQADKDDEDFCAIIVIQSESGATGVKSTSHSTMFNAAVLSEAARVLLTERLYEEAAIAASFVAPSEGGSNDAND
jgi:hypothetical protein